LAFTAGILGYELGVLRIVVACMGPAEISVRADEVAVEGDVIEGD
jgi:hypothetical protein